MVTRELSFKRLGFSFGKHTGEIVRETLLIVDYNKNLRMLYNLELSEEGYQNIVG